eukprot:1072412-Lingulodinium_polyedra.AAC.1
MPVLEVAILSPPASVVHEDARSDTRQRDFMLHEAWVDERLATGHVQQVMFGTVVDAGQIADVLATWVARHGCQNVLPKWATQVHALLGQAILWRRWFSLATSAPRRGLAPFTYFCKAMRINADAGSLDGPPAVGDEGDGPRAAGENLLCASNFAAASSLIRRFADLLGLSGSTDGLNDDQRADRAVAEACVLWMDQASWTLEAGPSGLSPDHMLFVQRAWRRQRNVQQRL